VVAQRLGIDEDEALPLGKAVAGLNAQAKGRRLGIFKPHEDKAKKAREKERGERFWIEVLGRPVPATNTEDGIRAVRGRNPIDPGSVRRYLADKFGDDLKAVRSAMQKLAFRSRTARSTSSTNTSRRRWAGPTATCTTSGSGSGFTATRC
jgi:hypothetical protein